MALIWNGKLSLAVAFCQGNCSGKSAFIFTYLSSFIAPVFSFFSASFSSSSFHSLSLLLCGKTTKPPRQCWKKKQQQRQQQPGVAKESWANTLGVKWIDDYINLCVCVSDRVHFVLTNMDSLSSTKRKGEKVCVHITQQQSHHGKRRVREEKSI